MNMATLPALLAPLNAAITPALRQGLASPLPFTGGLVLLEVTGRVSGEVRSVPLVCADHGNVLAVSTVRASSQWLKNLAAAREAAVWLRGVRRAVIPEVYVAGERRSPGSAESDWRSRLAACASRTDGLSVALLRLR
jgi:hypothetical protein